MVSVAQLVELRIVVPEAAGSSPVTHPTYNTGDFDKIFSAEAKKMVEYRICVLTILLDSM